MEIRDLETALHEAAHVVVGTAVGLRLDKAIVGAHAGRDIAGAAWFKGGPGKRRREAWALMYAAGIAWDRITHAPSWWALYDARALRRLSTGQHGAEAYIRAATALLAGLNAEQARIARALLTRDITSTDLDAMARGEEFEP